MGASKSLPILVPSEDIDYVVVSLSSLNWAMITVLFASQSELSLIRQSILHYWSLESEKAKLANCHTFILRGEPFSIDSSSVQAASSRQVICQILQSLNNAGLELKIACDLNRISDLTTLYFCRCYVPKIIHYPLLCISICSTDKLQLVNTPDNMVELIRDVVINTWTKGIQSEGPTENTYEIKLLGSPWLSQTEEGVQSRLLLATIISALSQHQWIFDAAINTNSTSDSLFFKYDPQAAGSQLANRIFVISLNNTDKLRLINAPPALLPIVRQAITSVWTVMGGIQREQDYYGSWEYKLSGNPWRSSKRESVMARFLISQILEACQSHGWAVKTSIGISRKSQDKSMFVMASSPPKPTSIMCLSLNDSNRIRLINAPKEFIAIFSDILKRRCLKGLSAEYQMNTHCPAYEFKLNGTPWIGIGKESLHIKGTLCYLIQTLSSSGWMYLVSADVSSKMDTTPKHRSSKYHSHLHPSCFSSDVHSLWFSYDPQSQTESVAMETPNDVGAS